MDRLAALESLLPRVGKKTIQQTKAGAGSQFFSFLFVLGQCSEKKLHEECWGFTRGKHMWKLQL